jgi:PRTRC genetic system protein B
MNTSVNIGSSKDFRLSRVLLVYGTSDYNGFPYRHPFICLHDVIHESDTARLSEGQLVTPAMLGELTKGLGQTVPIEILPERALVRTADKIVWWAPAQHRTLFFSDRGGDPILKQLNGKSYPQPALVFKAFGSHLWVRALAGNERPNAETQLYRAPYWNCYDDGSVCTGSMKIPRQKSVTAIAAWEQAFFQSEFTHAAGVARSTFHPGGMLALWRSVQGEKRFLIRSLAKARQTLLEFVSDDHQQNRNRQQAG